MATADEIFGNRTTIGNAEFVKKLKKGSTQGELTARDLAHWLALTPGQISKLDFQRLIDIIGDDYFKVFADIEEEFPAIAVGSSGRALKDCEYEVYLTNSPGAWDKKIIIGVRIGNKRYGIVYDKKGHYHFSDGTRSSNSLLDVVDRIITDCQNKLRNQHPMQ